ncbi:MAG: helix-turn-helix domain-containing protein [Bacteroides sp.]|nr:helix-turn-helix domain-containing protein [Bacteroides sp.]
MTKAPLSFLRFNSVRLAPEEQIGSHSQLTWELSYIVVGSGTRRLGDTTASFSSGEVVLVPPEVAHCWTFDATDTDEHGCIANITLEFETSFLERCAELFPELSTAVSMLCSLRDAIGFQGERRKAIIALLNDMENAPDAARPSLFLQLLLLMADYGESPVVGKRQEQDKHRQRLQQIHTYVVCNARRSIGIDDVARHVGMNRTSFCIYFKRATGKTFVTYLNEYRISLACQLLRRQRHATIAEVCYNAGFNNVPYFNRLFKQFMGMSPGEYAGTGPDEK